MRRVLQSWILLPFVLIGCAGIAHGEESSKSKEKKVIYRKTQEVNFEETDIEGVVRSPDGAYLLQKRGIDFAPLYKVDTEFEKAILGSVEYLR